MEKKIQVMVDNMYGRPVYKEVSISIRGDITQCMQMRFVYTYSEFECGLDVLTTDTGSHYIVSAVGICGRNLLEFLKSYIRYRIVNCERDIDGLTKIIFCDDPIHEDKENTIIDDERLLFGLI